MWVVVAAVLVIFMQARVHLPGDRLLPRQERRHDRREDLDELLDRRASVLGRRLRVRLRRRRSGHVIGDTGFFLRDYGDPQTAFPIMGFSDAHDRGEVPLPVRVLRRLAGDRLGHDARADQVRRLRHLRDRLLRADLPDRLALGLRRRLAAGQRRHAGLRRLDGGPPHRCDRRPGGAAAARRRARASTAPTASRGRSRGTTCRCSASASSSCWIGWFGFNPGSTLNALDTRFAEVALVTLLAAGRRRARRGRDDVRDHEDDRHRHGRQRRDRRARRDHRAVGLRRRRGPASSSASSPASSCRSASTRSTRSSTTRSAR